MVVNIILIITIALLALAFLNFKLAVALYVAYQILVPFLEVKIFGIPMSYNLVNIVFLFVFLFIFIHNKIRVDFKILKPYLIFMLLFLFLIPFQKETPTSYQLHLWRSGLMNGAILPLIIWNITKHDKKSLKYIVISLTIAIFISGIYGLLLTQMKGVNPYLLSLASESYNPKSFEGSSTTTRLLVYVQSTFGHPMAFGVFLMCALVFSIFWLKKTNKKVYYTLAILVVLNIIFCGIRSTILASMVGLFYYLINERSFKLVLYLSIATILFVILVSFNETLSQYFSISILSEKTSAIQGSSIEGRMSQFAGMVKEVQNSLVIGKGYGWTSLYLETYGRHPQMIAFESLLMIVLLNTGIVGVFFWIYFVLATFKVNKSIVKIRSDYLLLNILLILYISYTLVTGD